MNKKITLLNAALLTCFIGFSQASLQITEIWPGNGEGENLTADWFEITNVGDVAWTSANGNLYFVDERDEADYVEDAVIINGVTSIQPGESIIALNDEDTTEFKNVWSGVYNLTNTQIATHDGKGLGAGGDIVNLFVSSDVPTDNSTRVDTEAYPDTELNPGKSYDVTKGAFSIIGEAPYFPVATAVNDANEVAVASPGNSGTLSTNNISANTLKIFPMPFENELNIQTNRQTNVKSTVKIIDMLGGVVYNEKITLVNGSITLKRVSTLSSGVYVLHIPELNVIMKIVKK